jgi:hypothetical protein
MKVMVQSEDKGTSGVLTEAIEKLLSERAEILKTEKIPITYVWQVPIIISPEIGIMIDINEKLLVSIIMKFERHVVVNDLVRYVYKKVEDRLFDNDDEEFTIH